MASRKKSEIINFCRNNLLFADALILVIGYLLGGALFAWIRQAELERLGLQFSLLFKEWVLFYLLIIPAALVWFWYAGHYTRRKPIWDELKEILQVLTILFTIEAALLFLSKSSFSRLWLGASYGFAITLLPAGRILVKKLLNRLGRWQIPTVVIGTGQNAIDAITTLETEPLLGFQVERAYCLQDEEVPAGGSLQVNGHRVPVECLDVDPANTIRRLGEPNILFALESGGIRTHIDLLEELHRNFNSIYVVPALRGLPLYGMEINTFFRQEVLMLRVRNTLARRMPRLMKRSFDLLVTPILLALLAPLFLVLWLRIRSDGGAAIFAHRRIGYRGEPFDCLKFRTMTVDADRRLEELLANDAEARRQWRQDFKLKDDPRVTPVGKFLRSTSLDELPQLWNVLRGEMSLVGPRPVIVEELDRYGRDVHYYRAVRPGITGLWQVSGRSDTDYANRVYLDAWYVKNWSLWSDIVILMKTIGVVLAKRGAY